MPHRKKRPTVESLSDITGALKTQRWNYCQAMTRALYISQLTNDELRKLLQVSVEQYLRLIRP